MRTVSRSDREVMQFVRRNIAPDEVGLMYPEGDRYLWPRRTVWYLQGPDTETILLSKKEAVICALLREYDISYVVVKKHLIRDWRFAPASGYPTAFVKRLRNWPKFENVFENGDYIVFRVRG